MYRYTAIYSDTSHFYFHVVTFVLDTSLRQSRETKFVDFLLKLCMPAHNVSTYTLQTLRRLRCMYILRTIISNFVV